MLVNIEMERENYVFSNGFFVYVTKIRNDMVKVDLVKDNKLLESQELCCVNDKAEYKKIALQFFEDNCLKFGIDTNTVKFDHEERQFLVYMTGRLLHYYSENKWVTVIEEESAIRITGLDIQDYKIKKSYFQVIERCIIDYCEEYMKKRLSAIYVGYPVHLI